MWVIPNKANVTIGTPWLDKTYLSRRDSADPSQLKINYIQNYMQ